MGSTSRLGMVVGLLLFKKGEAANVGEVIDGVWLVFGVVRGCILYVATPLSAGKSVRHH